MKQHRQASVSCLECGVPYLAVRQAVLLVLSGTGRHQDAFRCPRCTAMVRFPADEPTGPLLVLDRDGLDPVPPAGTAA